MEYASVSNKINVWIRIKLSHSQPTESMDIHSYSLVSNNL